MSNTWAPPVLIAAKKPSIWSHPLTIAGLVIAGLLLIAGLGAALPATDSGDAPSGMTAAKVVDLIAARDPQAVAEACDSIDQYGAETWMALDFMLDEQAARFGLTGRQVAVAVVDYCG